MNGNYIDDDHETTKGLTSDQLRRFRDERDSQERASLIAIAGWEIGREIAVECDELVLGRSVSLPVSIGSASVSRQHAKIVCGLEGGKKVFRVVDLGSTNGTQVNNAPVQSALLQNGDKIQLGDVVFKFVLQDPLDALFHKEVHRRIHYDQLTGLLTFDTFRDHLNAEIERELLKGAGRPAALFTIAMTDLDGLKEINDTHGHLAGTQVIRDMGAMIRAILRPQDQAALYGGDETVLLFPETPLEEARPIAERLRATVEDHDFR